LPEAHAGPALPRGFAYLWTWFLELHAARGSSGIAHNPISFSDLLAWARLTGRRPMAWDVAVLRRIDGVFLEILSKRS
jgi:hypothetical protein